MTKYIFLFLLAITLGAGVSALLALVAMLLWNFIAVSTHHETAQVGFWVAWAAMFLLGLITSPFRATTKSKD